MYKYLFFLSSLLIFAVEASDKINSAACFISDNQGRLLVTRDIITNKIALPGGYVGKDEPKEAAKRETFEETGVRVEIVGELARLGRALLFDCRAIGVIPLYNISPSLGQVSAWQSEHFGREVRMVYMMDLNLISQAQARFPKRLQQFPAWLKISSVSKTENVEDFSHQASSFVLWNSRLNHSFQSWVKSLPKPLTYTLDGLLKWVSTPGNGGIFLLLIPFAMGSGGIKRTAELLFSMLSVSLVITFMTLIFAVPRPFYIYPNLQLGSAFGFAFVSENSAMAFSVLGLVYFWFKQVNRAYVYFFLLSTLLIAISDVYVGVNYVTDVILSALIGMLIAAISHFLYKKDQILRARLWGFLGLITVPLAVTQIHPVFMYCAIFSLTFSLLLLIFKSRMSVFSEGLNWPVCVFTLIGGASIIASVFAVKQISETSTGIVIANIIGLILLATMLCGISCAEKTWSLGKRKNLTVNMPKKREGRIRK